MQAWDTRCKWVWVWLTAMDQACVRLASPMPAGVSMLMDDSGVFPGLGVTIEADGSEHSWSLTDFNASSSSAGPWTLATPVLSATVVLQSRGTWSLTLLPACNLSRISFPLLPNGDSAPSRSNASETFFLLPILGGVFVRDDADCEWCVADDLITYPAKFHAPYMLHCTFQSCLMLASITWPPHQLVLSSRGARPQATAPLSIQFVDGYSARETIQVSVILDSLESDSRTMLCAWQRAVLRYRDWLQPHIAADPRINQLSGLIQPKAQVEAEGMLAVELQNIPTFNLTQLNETWQRTKWLFPRMQMWGQMSNCYCSNGKIPHSPPTLPGEETGCCLLNQSMHQRYLKAGLPQWVRAQIDIDPTAYQLGYYSRPVTPALDNLAWIRTWISSLAREGGGNAQYVDGWGRNFQGQPRKVLKLVWDGLLPVDSITEGWTDIWRYAGLLSGYNRGLEFANGGVYADGDSTNASTMIASMRPFEQHRNGSFINMVRLLMGEEIGYFGYEDGEYLTWGAKNRHYSERLAFLLGAKFEAATVEDEGHLNPVLVRVQKLRQAVGWWQKGMVYRDTIGVHNPTPHLIDVRRFDASSRSSTRLQSASRRDNTSNASTMLVVDNWRMFSGLSVWLDGRRFDISSEQLSIIVVR